MIPQSIIIYKDLEGKIIDFSRYGCKKATTVLKNEKAYKNWCKLNSFSIAKQFFTQGAKFEVWETPDGYHKTKLLSSGIVKDI